jgi:hypothetical protein
MRTFLTSLSFSIPQAAELFQTLSKTTTLLLHLHKEIIHRTLQGLLAQCATPR